MMNSLIIGQYVPRDSFIHRLDPRTKISGVFLFILIVFLANSITSYLLLTAFTVLTVLFSKIPVSYISKGLKPVIWIVAITFLLHIFMTKGGDILLDLGWLKVHEAGVREGIYISIRFFLLIVVTTLLTLTTTPIEITDGIESLLGPFRKIGVPAHELALMMSISLRFIPTLMQETEKIMKAQSARGVSFSTGPIKDRVLAIIPLLIPLFVSSFRRAEDLALAMEARGYRGGEGRTKFREMKWELRDTFVLILIIVLGCILALLRF